MANDKTTQELVSMAINHAIENESYPFSMSDVELAEDLMKCDADLESREFSDVLSCVVAERKKHNTIGTPLSELDGRNGGNAAWQRISSSWGY